MPQVKVGIQLIIYGERVRSDLAGVLGEVKSAGFEGIETGNLFNISPQERVMELLKEHDLVVAGVHVGYNDVADEGKLSEHIEYLKRVGGKYLICSGVAKAEGIKAYELAADTFNSVGKRCAEEGLVFCYHNHAWEFETFDGVKGIHRLAELTEPELVRLCVDVYWVTVGGEDPVEFIRRYITRSPYFHFKDGAPGEFTELGKGKVNLHGSLQAAMDANAEWIVYEQDRTSKPVIESIRESREHLRKLGV
ncbi:MAG: sugar phosphate isomerase/epimerase [Armatimonadota bacterium]|nr:sugar phosphate isomerase/epimerase [Armatimonadota bacterium]MCX7778235.1 sugar phosphate isomerase/epimerase [Armatimonadota bacterium]MDW8024954.1 sugar phosphate isomerase/epimerase [Armatimonadota bacterium]